MKHAFLIVAHAYPELLNEIVERLYADNHYFFIHIDRHSENMLNSKIVERLRNKNNIHIYSCVSVNWGGYSQVRVTLFLIEKALSYACSFDYFHLISGQDYPLKSNKEFDVYFLHNAPNSFMGFADSKGMENRYELFHLNDIFNLRGQSFYGRIGRGINSLSLKIQHLLTILGVKIRKPLKYTLFKGSNWWSLSNEVVEYVQKYLRAHPEYIKRFYFTNCCDEIFFHVLIMNSPLKHLVVRNNLRYIDWSDKGRGSLPNILIKEDYKYIEEKENIFFMRKVDPIRSKDLLDLYRNK